MILSRIELPWESARNPYELHRNVWRLFPGEKRESRASGEDSRQGFLFRIERHSTGRPARLLVQSRRPPVPADGISLLGTREFHPQPEVNQRLGFVLTANVVKTITDTARDAKPDKKSEKSRVPLIREEDRRDWLRRKLEASVDVETAEVLAHPPLYFRKGGYGGKIATCTFEGVLRVKEPDSLKKLLENGIGPAKAFGCGLLLVRSLR